MTYLVEIFRVLPFDPFSHVLRDLQIRFALGPDNLCASPEAEVLFKTSKHEVHELVHRCVK